MSSVHSLDAKEDRPTYRELHDEVKLMRMRSPVLLVVLKYIDSPSTARISLTVWRVGRCRVFEGIEQVPREGKDCVISVSDPERPTEK